jgi:hypothetical protein
MKREMSPTPTENDQPSEGASAEFSGFEQIDANFLYCPNQFLDVCLPHFSRGVVRLVALILDQTLGWLDGDGNPITEDVTVSYNRLVSEAGISRGAARKAIDEALAAGFITCITPGRRDIGGQPAQRGTYALRWDETGAFHQTPDSFQGFYAGDGHRTPIPNAFFRTVIPRETLTVTKVVGSVLRHTVGYQNQFGGRRSQAPLSYTYLQSYANITDPKTLCAAISAAIESRYLIRVDEGRFDFDPAKRKPTTYGINWLQEGKKSDSRSKIPVGDRSRKPSRHGVQESQQRQSTNPSSTGSRIPAGDRFKNPSQEKTSYKHRRIQV